MIELDPRWDWVEVTEFGACDPSYIRGRCHHLELIAVEDIYGDEVVAYLCLTCDTQLPA